MHVENEHPKIKMISISRKTPIDEWTNIWEKHEEKHQYFYETINEWGSQYLGKYFQILHQIQIPFLKWKLLISLKSFVWRKIVFTMSPSNKKSHR